jgi:hypothetical protein
VSRALVLALVALAGCAANEIFVGEDMAAATAPRDLGFSGECALTVLAATPDGQCRADWVCRDAGVLTLACGRPSDGGVSCVCGSARPTVIATTPPVCEDAALVTAFARKECGWSFL